MYAVGTMDQSLMWAMHAGDTHSVWERIRRTRLTEIQTMVRQERVSSARM